MPGGIPPVWGGGEDFSGLFNEPGAQSWDTVGFGEEQNPPPLPGLARVRVKRARKIDERSGSGRNGARLIDKGSRAADVQIRLMLWTDEQLDALADRMPSLDYTREQRTRVRELSDQELERDFASRIAAVQSDPASRRFFVGTGAMLPSLPTRIRETVSRLDRAPVNIIHPATILANITQVYVVEVEIEELQNQMLPVTIKCLEFKPEYTRRSISLSPSRPRQTASIADVQTTAAFRPNNRSAAP